jgi:hypothetical protein
MVDASLSLRLLHKEGDRSERLAPLAPVAGPLTRSLRPEGVGEDLRASSIPDGTFAFVTSISGALITRQRRNRDFFGPSPARSFPSH